MDEVEIPVLYASFRSFVECCGQRATHRVRGDRYVGPVSADDPCYFKSDSDLMLCDRCLAFWWQCRENRELATWVTALSFRDQFEASQVNRVLASSADEMPHGENRI
jgi:hypothetical protein